MYFCGRPDRTSMKARENLENVVPHFSALRRVSSIELSTHLLRTNENGVVQVERLAPMLPYMTLEGLVHPAMLAEHSWGRLDQRSRVCGGEIFKRRSRRFCGLRERLFGFHTRCYKTLDALGDRLDIGLVEALCLTTAFPHSTMIGRSGGARKPRGRPTRPVDG